MWPDPQENFLCSVSIDNYYFLFSVKYDVTTKQVFPEML